MAFGLSFGKKKQSGSQTTNVNKTETQSGIETGTKASTGTTTGTSATQSTQTGTQTGQTTQATTGSQQQQSQTSLFSADTLAALESAASGLLGNVGKTPQDQYSSGFDVRQFVGDAYGAAENRLNSDLGANVNNMYDSYGGQDDTNSMVALLENRLRTDTEAQLGGVRAALEAQGQGIAREDYLAGVQGQGAATQQLQSVLDSLKGGMQSTTGAVQTQENVTGTQAQQSQQTGTQTTQTQEVQNLVEQLQNIMAGTTQTVGTESTKSKGKTAGGGFSLAI